MDKRISSGTILAQASDEGLKPYNPLEEAPEAYLKFADIVSDMWATEEVVQYQKRISKAENFCREFGPPAVVTGPDLDIASVGLRPRELADRDLDPGRTNALSRLHANGKLPIVMRCDYGDLIHQAKLMAVAVRCYQAVQIDWRRYQPSLKRYLKSADSVELFETIRSRTGIGSSNGNDCSITAWAHELDVSVNDCLDDEFAMRIYLTLFLKGSAEFSSLRSPDIFLDRKTLDYRIDNGCTSLGSVMWLQLQQAILAKSTVRQCAASDCQEIFEVLGRSDQKYHDHRCRSNHGSKKHIVEKKRRKDFGVKNS